MLVVIFEICMLVVVFTCRKEEFGPCGCACCLREEKHLVAVLQPILHGAYSAGFLSSGLRIERGFVCPFIDGGWHGMQSKELKILHHVSLHPWM